jgi:hypothetical protein
VLQPLLRAPALSSWSLCSFPPGFLIVVVTGKQNIPDSYIPRGHTQAGYIDIVWVIRERSYKSPWWVRWGPGAERAVSRGEEKGLGSSQTPRMGEWGGFGWSQGYRV